MSRARYYRRDGTPIRHLLTWARLMEDRAYKRVAETTLEDGTWISTVWLGLDHRFISDGPPIIFETMVFSPEKVPSKLFPDKSFSEEWDSARYSTEAEAIMGHDAMVRKWRTIREEWKKTGIPSTIEASARKPHPN